MSFLLPLYHLGQALVSVYTGILSYSSIRKVQTYEEATTKAAKYSNIADHHLQTTRTTQAAGAISVLSSLSTATYLLSTRGQGTAVPAFLSISLAMGITFAHTHVSNYWRGKWKVPLPGSGDYNDAITTSNQMRFWLGALAASWALVAMGYTFRWVS